MQTHADRPAVDALNCARDRLGSALLVLAAVGALVGGILGITDLGDVGSQVQRYTTWHAFGLLTFAGIFLLLAVRPRSYPGIWELAIVNKAALGTAWFFERDADHAADGVVDIIRGGVLVVAYTLTRAWTGWHRWIRHA
jgi:hypothetical protein